MRSPFIIIPLLIFILNISVFSSLKDINFFGTEMSTSLEDTSETEKEVEEFEETEKEFLSTTHGFHLNPPSHHFYIHASLPVYISTYAFSIFIPPLFRS